MALHDCDMKSSPVFLGDNFGERGHSPAQETKSKYFWGICNSLRLLSRSHAQALRTSGQDKQTQLKPQGQSHNDGEGKPQEWRKAGCTKASGR